MNAPKRLPLSGVPEATPSSRCLYVMSHIAGGRHPNNRIRHMEPERLADHYGVTWLDAAFHLKPMLDAAGPRPDRPIFEAWFTYVGHGYDVWLADGTYVGVTKYLSNMRPLLKLHISSTTGLSVPDFGIRWLYAKGDLSWRDWWNASLDERRHLRVEFLLKYPRLTAALAYAYGPAKVKVEL